MTKLFWRLMLAAVGCHSAAAIAGVNAFTAIGPEGGSITKVAYGPAQGTVYALAPAGLFRSLDNGGTWSLRLADMLGAPFDFAVDPADSQRVYAAFADPSDVYMSLDGGTTFNPVTTLPYLPDGFLRVAVDTSGQTVYCTSGARVYRSTDRAQTWQAGGAVSSYAAVRFERLIVDPADANTVYAIVYATATSEGVMASHDGGASWQALFMADPAGQQAAFDLAINPKNSAELWLARNDGVWKSADHGTTWTNLALFPAGAIAIDSASPSIIYVGAYPGLMYRTADGGGTWTDVTGNVYSGNFRSIAVNPTLHTSLLVGGDAGLYGSDVSGTTWVARQTGLLSASVASFTADAAADRIYLAAPSVGLYYTQGGAAIAKPVNNIALAQLGGTPNFQYVSAVLAEPGRLWASMGIGLAHSEDAGNKWSLVVVPPSGPRQLFHFASDPATPQDILGATFTTVYKSVDSGMSWSATAGIPAGQISQLLVAHSNPGIAYAQAYSADGLVNFGVYKSSDAGATFVPASADPSTGPTQLLAVHPANPSLLYGTSNTSLLASHDAGATWTPMPVDATGTPGSVFPLTIDPIHPQVMFAWSQRLGVARTADGGANWQVLRGNTVKPLWSVMDLVSDPNRPENLLVATYNTGAQLITISPDLALAISTNPGTVGTGTPFTLGYTLSNHGPFDASGARVTLQLPATAQKATATIAGGSCVVAGTELTCTCPVLRNGASAAIALNLTLPATGPASIAATATADQPDVHAQDNVASAKLNVTGHSDMSVTATGTTSAQTGQAVSYSISAQNAGPDTASAPTIAIQAASGLGSLAATPDKGSCSTSGHAITCKLPDLASGAKATVAITATASSAGSMKSTVTVTSLVFDPAAANNSASVSTAVTNPPAPDRGSSGGGGALSPAALLLLALLAPVALHRRVRCAPTHSVRP